MKRLIKISLMAMLLVASNAAAQKSYDDIYASMPNLSHDQAYSELLDFQKRNPFFANVYLQLGIVSEKIMVLTDPLRDFETAQLWANNANLFIGNFGVYYKDGDVRSNDEYYANLGIQYSGKRIEEADLKRFVEKHKALCKNYKDTTALAFHAIEKSKHYYNQCVTSFGALCDRYENLNEALLQYDANLQKELEQLGRDIDACVAAFDEYKAIIKAYPILNYRQIYEFRTIETFRLDGLTNSDFYENRFTMWDYRKWIDQYFNTIKNDILPLREKIEAINRKFVQGKAEYEGNKPVKINAEPAYNDLFIFQLGRYDNSSLVRELFTYLDNRRELMAMAHDSISLPIDSSATLINRKMRNIYRICSTLGDTELALENLSAAVTPERIARFSDFFNNNYAGENGLKSYSTNEKQFINSILYEVLRNFGHYMNIVEEQRTIEEYSTKSTKYAAVPLWVVSPDQQQDIKGQYITEKIVYDNYGRPQYVAGMKKGTTPIAFVAKIENDKSTGWITEIKKTSAVNCLTANGQGCIIAVTQNNLPYSVSLDANGKAGAPVDINEGSVAFINYNDITKNTFAAFNEGGGGVSLCLTDSLGAKMWDIRLSQLTEACAMAEVSDGLLVIGKNNNSAVVMLVASNGTIVRTETLGTAANIEAVYRASAQEICVFSTTGSTSQWDLAIVSDKCEIQRSTLH